MANSWSKHEVKEIVKDYFLMLSSEINNIPYNKTQHRKELINKLSNRSGSSIEFKHQNISAVLIKYGRPYIIGYKPRSNFQRILEVEVLEFLEENSLYEEQFEKFSSEDSIPKKSIENINYQILVEDSPDVITVKEPTAKYETRISKTNYIEREQKNIKLGYLGEELVFNYEKWRLNDIGKYNLSDSVEWISRDKGDGAGYDILSKNKNGTDRCIEVKTTKLGKLTPIYISRNELKFSKINSQKFHLYRVYQFGNRTRMFQCKGDVETICHLEPINYIGKFI